MYEHLQSLELGLLRPPADRPAHVARDGRPAGGALLPRLRPRLHHAVGADDPARRRGDVRRAARARGDLARSRCRSWSSSPRATAGASRPALQEVQQRIAELTADVEENIGGVRVVKAFAREDRQLERFRGQRRARLRPGDGLHAPAGLLQPVHRLPAPARPRGDPLLRRAPGHRRAPDDRRVHRLLRLPAHAAVADAHARHRCSAWRSARPPPARGSSRSSTASRGSSSPPDAPRAAARLGPRRAARRDAAVRGRVAPGAARRRPRRRRRARPSRSSAPPARARRRSSQLIPRLYDATAGAVLVDGADVRDVDVASLRARDRGRRRRPVPVQRHRAPRTSPTRAPTPRREEIELAAAARPGRTTSSRACPTATTRASASAG